MEKDLALAGLMHDLSNVLQTIGHAADVLSSDPKWTDLAATLAGSVERAKAIIESTAEGLSEVALLSVARRAARGTELQVEIDVPDALRFRGKPLAIERVLNNLLANSVRVGAAKSRIRALLDGQCLTIQVSDDGPGIKPELLSTIFQPGFTTTSSLGLGLYIVESIVSDHRGFVEAANVEDGTGAVFTIRIPVVP